MFLHEYLSECVCVTVCMMPVEVLENVTVQLVFTVSWRAANLRHGQTASSPGKKREFLFPTREKKVASIAAPNWTTGERENPSVPETDPSPCAKPVPQKP